MGNRYKMRNDIPTVVLTYDYLTARIWYKPWTWRRRLYQHKELMTKHQYEDMLWKYDRTKYHELFGIAADESEGQR